MSQENDERLVKLLEPIDYNLKLYRNAIEDLKKELDRDEPDIDKIYDSSSKTSFYYHLLSNHFCLDNSFFWYCFTRESEREPFMEKVGKKMDELRELEEEMEEIDERMYQHIDDYKRDHGEVETEKLIESGFIPPASLLIIREDEEDLGYRIEEENEINKAYQ